MAETEQLDRTVSPWFVTIIIVIMIIITLSVLTEIHAGAADEKA